MEESLNGTISFIKFAFSPIDKQNLTSKEQNSTGNPRIVGKKSFF